MLKMAGKSADITSKLSKKVAELTVVVHMLFKRNHEKEVEYEFFKLLSEQERIKLKEENRAKVDWLEGQLEGQEAYRAKVEYQLQDLKKLQEKMSTLEASNEELNQQLNARDEDLRIANIQLENLKQQIEGYVKELGSITKNENTQTNEEISKDEVVEDNDEEIKKLEEKLAELKRKHKDEITKLYTEKVMLQNRVDNYNTALSQEIKGLKETLDVLSTRQAEDQRKLNEMELEKKDLEQSLNKSDEEKKSFQKKTQILKEQLRLLLRSKNSPKNLLREGASQEPPKRNLFETRDEELERLRHEVNLYRMELQNREGNFNKMFADQQPVVLKTQADKHLVERNLTGTRIGRRQHHLPKLTDGRSMTFMSGIKRTTFL